jgi:hypothetical protein
MNHIGAIGLAGLMLAGIVAMTAPAAALDIRAQSSKDLHQFEHMPNKEVSKFFAGRTFLFKSQELNGGVRAVLPISGVAILYMAPNGTLLGWSDKSGNVEAGVWRVNNTNGNDLYFNNQLCFGFPEGGRGQACSRFGTNINYFPESTAGNPFGLKGESAAPFDLGRFGVSLKSVAKKLGL